MPSSNTAFNCDVTTSVGPGPAGSVTTTVTAPPQLLNVSSGPVCPPALGALSAAPKLFCLAALTVPKPLSRKIKERVIVEKRVDCVNVQPE